MEDANDGLHKARTDDDVSIEHTLYNTLMLLEKLPNFSIPSIRTVVVVSPVCHDI